MAEKAQKRVVTQHRLRGNYTDDEKSGAKEEWIRQLMCLADVNSNKKGGGGCAEFRDLQKVVVDMAPEIFKDRIRNVPFVPKTKGIHGAALDQIVQEAQAQSEGAEPHAAWQHSAQHSHPRLEAGSTSQVDTAIEAMAVVPEPPLKRPRESDAEIPSAFAAYKTAKDILPLARGVLEAASQLSDNMKGQYADALVDKVKEVQTLLAFLNNIPLQQPGILAQKLDNADRALRRPKDQSFWQVLLGRRPDVRAEVKEMNDEIERLKEVLRTQCGFDLHFDDVHVMTVAGLLKLAHKASGDEAYGYFRAATSGAASFLLGRPLT